MNQLGTFGGASQVSVTVLVDNRADLIVRSSDTIKYFTDEPLLAEHGFAALIDLPDAEQRILWDAGVSRVALIENMRRMEIDPGSIAQIALSHGHHDHVAALTELLAAMHLAPEPKDWGQTISAAEVDAWREGHRIPLIAHPAALRERWAANDDGTKYGPMGPPPRQEWEAAGARIVLSEDPYPLGPGCWTTGYVPRRSFERSGRSSKRLYRQGDALLHDDLEDDQAIAIHVRGKGLVVVSGCAHAGIVNTVRHTQEISGVNTVWAILGGFHLARAEDDEIQRTIDAIATLKPKLVVPCHCTGFRAMCMFAAQMPDAYAEGIVGATYLF